MHDSLKNQILALCDTEPRAFYVYDRSVIRENCRSFMTIPYEPKLITFASMANASGPFLETVRSEGVSIFVNSLGHLATALETGFKGEEIVFTSSAMEESTMREVARVGAICNLDSVGQVTQWFRLFPDRPVGIRCNIGDRVEAKKTRGGYFLGKNSRLGLDIHEIEALGNKDMINGLHLYLGTDIIDLDYFRLCYETVAELAAMFPNLDYLDFGGGFGITTESGLHFNIETYGRAVSEIMEKVSADHGRPVKLILEPGRIIGGESAWFIARVTDVKERGDSQLIGVNASTAQFTRPLMYPDDSYHPITVVKGDTTTQVKSAVYGCSTYSRDFFAKEIDLPRLAPGDIIAFGHAGSYCASSYTHFLGFDKAPEYYL